MDHFWTYNAPLCPNAVQWSQDNQLAVACGHTAVVLAPGHLDGPRASVAPPVAGVSSASALEGLCVEGLPREPDKSESLVWAVAGEVRADEGREGNVSRTHVRSLAWSAAGCTPQAGCYLAMVTTDNKVSWSGGKVQVQGHPAPAAFAHFSIPPTPTSPGIHQRPCFTSLWKLSFTSMCCDAVMVTAQLSTFPDACTGPRVCSACS